MIWQHEIDAVTVDADDRALIVRRGRVSALAILSSVALFTIVDLLAAPPATLPRHLGYKSFQATIAIAAFVVLGRPRLQRFAGAILLAGIAAMMASMVPPAILRRDLVTGPILIGVMTFWSATLFPWHPARQALIAAMGIATILTLVQMVQGLAGYPPYPLVAMSVAMFASVTISQQLRVRHRERRRVEVVLRASEAEMRRTSERLAEEARTAEALLHVGATLNAHLRAPDMIERVNRLAVAALGCDWSVTYLWNEQEGGVRLAGAAGVPVEQLAELGSIVFPTGMVTLPTGIDSVLYLEQPDAASAEPAVAALMARFDVASFFCTVIHEGGTIHAAIAHGHRVRTGRISAAERRLAIGLAQSTAIALDNARLIRDLEAASRLKSEFVATMSHELRTPLNVIVGYVDMLDDGGWGAMRDPQREPIARIRQSALELLALVDQTLDLNRLDTGRATLDVAATTLAPLLAEVAQELAPLAAAGVALHVEAQPVDAVVVTDRTKIKTIVKNLAGNALKFTEHGTVTVDAHVEPGALRIVVRDTGIGIAREHQHLIFEVFRQVDGSNTRRFGGVGLGLHIVKRLVDLLGGTIEVASTPGSGSTFTVRLPIPTATALRAAS